LRRVDALFEQVTELLSHCWTHLSNYYSYQVGDQEIPRVELELTSEQRSQCDAFDDPAQISKFMYLISEHLKGKPFDTLYRLIEKVPEFCELIFRDLEVDPVSRGRLELYKRARRSEERPEFNTRFQILEIQRQVEGNCTWNQWLYLVAPIWGCCMGDRRYLHMPADQIDRAAYLMGAACSSLDAYLLYGHSTLNHIYEFVQMGATNNFYGMDVWLREGGARGNVNGFLSMMLGMVSPLDLWSV
jgi:hypothetical protein